MSFQAVEAVCILFSCHKSRKQKITYITISQSLVGDGTYIAALGLFVKLSCYIENYNRNITVKSRKIIPFTSLKLKLQFSLICLLATLTPMFQTEVT